MDLNIKNKVAIVTGAASQKGVGNAVAKALAAEGVNVVVTDIMEEGVQALAAELQKSGVKAMAIKADQSNMAEVKAAVEQVKAEMGSVDILVNCAALTNNYGTIARMTEEKWNFEIDVNLNGAFYWVNQVLPLMKEDNWGRIVNISSVAGNFGTTGLPCYAVTKGAIHTMTKQIARENAKGGITANCLVLGIIATEIYERGGIDQATVDRLIDHIPMNRMGKPSEIADMVTFLCSKQASYTTGAIVPVDGAFSVSI